VRSEWVLSGDYFTISTEPECSEACVNARIRNDESSEPLATEPVCSEACVNARIRNDESSEPLATEPVCSEACVNARISNDESSEPPTSTVLRYRPVLKMLWKSIDATTTRSGNML
jgi:hypothetical protein